MSADLLRRAAALMRERAEEPVAQPDRWAQAVAPALADWLENVAATFDVSWQPDEDGNLVGYDLDGDPLRFEDSQDSLALAVARAYLGEAS